MHALCLYRGWVASGWALLCGARPELKPALEPEVSGLLFDVSIPTTDMSALS